MSSSSNSKNTFNLHLYQPFFLNKSYRLAEMTGRPMRVVGWYHSHPHITVWPSHVGKHRLMILALRLRTLGIRHVRLLEKEDCL